MQKQYFTLVHTEARQRAMQAVKLAPDGYGVVVQEPTRSLDANAAMWPILECFARQKKWPVNGENVFMSSEEWKDVLTAAFEKESVRLAQGVDGGVVMLGRRTRDYGKRKFSDWMEFLHATAAHFQIDLR